MKLNDGYQQEAISYTQLAEPLNVLHLSSYKSSMIGNKIDLYLTMTIYHCNRLLALLLI